MLQNYGCRHSLFWVVCGTLEAEDLAGGALEAVGLIRGHAGVNLGVENDALRTDLQISLAWKMRGLSRAKQFFVLVVLMGGKMASFSGLLRVLGFLATPKSPLR